MTTLIDDARRLIARDLPAVQSVMLGVQQWDVLQFIRRMSPNPVRCHEISSEFGLSAQHSAGIMAVLFRKGYVTRSDATAPSGGDEYEYRARPLFK
jgi:predicted transcriptional regulator